MVECGGCGKEVTPIDTDSDQWCDVLDSVKKYADMKKEELVAMLYDPGGSNTLKELRSMSRGELIVELIVSIYGG